ncbi:hypothetical protein OsI_27640 [Oryza sativa Indica Group]|uniref:Uncharacterized protein n=1 Tax=Oryza sativa subsp. indica TaxID=39946 RepID=B8BAD8_ORYSI|nr:hypothetical protein OsI_27640 [Oryza sativa Indica Group]
MTANPQMEELSAIPSSDQVQPLETAEQPTAMATAAAEAVAIPVEEELKRAAEKMENNFSKIKTKIHRYPSIFRSLISTDDRYFVPRAVAIGPYHHGAPHLKEAEEVKRAAAYYFCGESGHSVEEVYQRILLVAAEARSCYVDDDTVASIGEGDFAAIMFHDGCFLLQYIICSTDDIAPSLESWFNSNDASMERDIFLLENQLPWVVLDALMTFRSVPVGEFISQESASFDAYTDLEKRSFVLDESYTPSHLPWPPSNSSAIELAEIGINLVANKKTWFNDMSISKGALFGKLFMAPLVMDDQNACWLINMMALEICSASTGMASTGMDGEDTVCSYVSLLAMLMSREEDVHELRVKRILHGDFSNQRTLVFFKNLVDLIPIPFQHSYLLDNLEAYRRKRWMWIPIHKFIYNNLKTIVTVFSIIGVLVGIFKTLMSIKQHQQ